MKLTIRTDYKTATTILSNVYEADKSATYANKKRVVVGNALSASIEYDAKGCYVDVQSNYYTLASLREITSGIRQG